MKNHKLAIFPKNLLLITHWVLKAVERALPTAFYCAVATIFFANTQIFSVNTNWAPMGFYHFLFWNCAVCFFNKMLLIFGEQL